MHVATMHLHRRHAKTCRPAVAAVAAISFGMLVFICCALHGLSGGGGALRQAVIVAPRRLPLSLGSVLEVQGVAASRREPPEEVTEAVLLPDWETLVVLQPNASVPGDEASCVFRGGSASPARAHGRLPGSGRQAYTCAIPERARRSLPFYAPRVVSSSYVTDLKQTTVASDSGSSREMLRWNGRLVYDAAALDDGDVLVFAKGVNPRQGANRPATDIRCIYHRGNANDVVAALPASTSAQEVFRCPPPPMPARRTSPELRVTLAVAGDAPIPSLGTYSAPRGAPVSGRRRLPICACTMVRDVSKFLREWVVYHAAVGVDRFYLYDNGSEDDLEDQVHQLSSDGFDVSTVAWPWPKTQEAGFSHCAAVHQESCEWVAFVDVDEFIFSPSWTRFDKPDRSMLQSITAVASNVGQISLGCVEFGPSGRTVHPQEGVTQGYTCRRHVEERHKSLIRLNSVDRTLMNSIHHFWLQDGSRTERVSWARVNHYKYQAWDEFKVKFRRRVSAYVVDWTDRANFGSKDRTPGLGFEAVEPLGWAHRFCEVNDTQLRDATQRWFGVGNGYEITRTTPY